MYLFLLQFNDMMGDMLGWLTDAERLLTSEYTIGNDPVKIKGQIAKHKVFCRFCVVVQDLNTWGQLFKHC